MKRVKLEKVSFYVSMLEKNLKNVVFFFFLKKALEDQQRLTKDLEERRHRAEEDRKRLEHERHAAEEEQRRALERANIEKEAKEKMVKLFCFTAPSLLYFLIFFIKILYWPPLKKAKMAFKFKKSFVRTKTVFFLMSFRGACLSLIFKP